MSDQGLVVVHYKGNVATGFLHVDIALPQQVFIFTVKHLFDGSVPSDSTEVRIVFDDADRTPYTVSSTDGILLGEDIDYALLTISVERVPAAVLNRSTLRIGRVVRKYAACIVSGYPKWTRNEVSRSLFQVKLLPQTDFEGQLQLELSDPLADHYAVDELTEGYSGSPIMVDVDSEFFVIGLFLAYDEPGRRIQALSLQQVIDSVRHQGGPEFRLQTVETDQQALTDITALRKNSNYVLGRIYDSIGSVELTRASVVSAIAGLIVDHPLVLVSGVAGSGKSSATKKALSQLDASFEIIAVQGEQLDRKSIDEIFRSFNVVTPVDSLLDSVGMKVDKILFIDSIEKVLETDNPGTIADLLTLLKSRRDVRVVVTCRSYAVELLRIRFFQSARPHVFSVPILTDEEIAEVVREFEFLEPIVRNPSVKTILQIPFNLDKARLMADAVNLPDVNSMTQFRDMAWKYIVENALYEKDLAEQKRRGEVFKQIAWQRAQLMTPHVLCSVIGHHAVIDKLRKDNIVNVDTAGEACAPAHDIYEDWAIAKFIESQYGVFVEGQGDARLFFQALGLAPAARRSFREWIEEKIGSDATFELFLKSALGNHSSHEYWTDEIIIAVLQSSYSEFFLESAKNLFFDDNFRLLGRALLLLNVACQETQKEQPVTGAVETITSSFLNAHMKPSGPGWDNMLRFIFRNWDRVSNRHDLVMPFLFQWSRKGVNNGKPSEMSLFVQLLVRMIDRWASQSEEKNGFERFGRKVLELLFVHAHAAGSDVKRLAQRALEHDATGRYPGETDEICEIVTGLVLSGPYGPVVSLIAPDLVISIAEKEWFFHQPTHGKEIAGRKSNLLRTPRTRDEENDFGIKSEDRLGYRPASAYQTPLHGLLRNHWEAGLSFICKLLNHSVEAFWQSDFMLKSLFGFRTDTRIEIAYTLPTGEVITQKGSQTLWTMYRGTYVATPYLLQSVLMALEEWLLKICKAIETAGEKRDEYQDILDTSVDRLMRESRSIATSAVLVSVATAHPDLVFRKIIPLLRVREVFEWDYVRYQYEKDADVSKGLSEFDFFYQKERRASNSLPHRKKHLGMLFLELNGSFQNDIRNILDAFYKEEPLDIKWQSFLNKMDRAKQVLVSETDSGFVVKTEFDAAVAPLVEQSQRMMREINQISQATLWAKNILIEGKGNSDLETWRRHFQMFAGYVPSFKEAMVYYNPALVCAVGVRWHYKSMTPKEIKYCAEKIFSVIDRILYRSINMTGFDGELREGAFESDACLVALSDLIVNGSGDIGIAARDRFFLCLSFMHFGPDKDMMLKYAKPLLWKQAPDFAIACVRGLIAYGKIAKYCQILEVRAWRRQADRSGGILKRWWGLLRASSKRLAKKLRWGNERVNLEDPDHIEQFFEREREQIRMDVAHGKITMPLISPEEGIVDHYLIESACFVPADTQIPELLSFNKALVGYLHTRLSTQGKYEDRKIPPETLDKFFDHFAEFILTQPEDIAVNNFQALISPAFTGGKRGHGTGDFIRETLDSVLARVLINGSNERFWQLWERLAFESKAVRSVEFSSQLLLSHPYVSSEQKDWVGMEGRAPFFEEVVSNLGSVELASKLISRIGYKALMPAGLVWIEELLNRRGVDGGERYLNDLIVRVFYDTELRYEVRRNKILQKAFMRILDELINRSSALAFIIREDFIALT